MDRVFGSVYMIGSIVVLLCLSVAVLSAAGNSAVADAVMRGDHAAVEKLVEQHADVNAPQADGATALHWAVFASDKAIVDLLLRAGANPKAANRDGSTPLWLASINGDAPIIAALLNAGADANEHLPLGRSPLMVASRTGNVDAIKVLAGPWRGCECQGNPARNHRIDVGRRRRACARHPAPAPARRRHQGPLESGGAWKRAGAGKIERPEKSGGSAGQSAGGRDPDARN